MQKIFKLIILFLVGIGFVFAGQAAVAATWVESPTHPIYDPIAVAEKAYYPSVLKMGANDYRMWYQSNSTPSNSTVAYATSADGLSWTLVTNAVSGLLPGNAGHPHVEFADGKFRIWYWNAATPYGNTAMHYAESVDGVTWTNDSAITGNLVTATGGLWNSGIYGAADVIINRHPTNTGTNPFDYKYAMYYDATSGGYEQIALGYSADGIAWTLYGTGPVVPKGPTGSWDSGYVAIGSTVVRGNTWTMWYIGGISASNEGIGCATSNDGLTWTKCAANPIMHKNDGFAWRNSRTYTPAIIWDGGFQKMWFTCRDTATSNYAICYATLDMTGIRGLYESLDGEVSLPDSTSDLILDNTEVVNVADIVNTVSGGTVVISGVATTLSNFTSGDLTGVNLSTPKNIGGKSVIAGKAIKINSGLVGVPTVITNSALGSASVSIPDNTTILAPGGWDGTIAPPKTALTSGDTAPVGFSIGTAIDVGSPGEVLLFDKPVLVTLNGVTGSVGYKPAGLTAWTQITAACSGTYDVPTLSAASFPGECSATNGIDTKILTYHLTTFGELSGSGEISSPAVVPPVSVTPRGSTITIMELIHNDSGGTATYTDFPLFINGVPTNSGETKPLVPGVYTVTETNRPGYTVNFTGDCDANGKIVIGSYGIVNAICTVVNDDIGAPLPDVVPPLIDILKVPSPLALPGGPGPVTYTYTVTNIGVAPMTGISLLGDTCKPIVFVSGDTNGDKKLDVGEKWVYNCTTNLIATTKNTVVAFGHANGLDTTHITSAIVVVDAATLPPLIHATMVPTPLALPAGGGVVTYKITVTNPGAVPLTNVGVSEDVLGGNIHYVSGDTNGDSKLDPGETWIYTVQVNLTKTTTNTVVASGLANGLVATDFALSTVVVAGVTPGLPSTALSFPSDLKLGARGADVKALQEYLNANGYALAASGLGSSGFETDFFGRLTQEALIQFQKDKGISPAVGYFGPITRAYIGAHP